MNIYSYIILALILIIIIKMIRMSISLTPESVSVHMANMVKAQGVSKDDLRYTSLVDNIALHYKMRRLKPGIVTTKEHYKETMNLFDKLEPKSRLDKKILEYAKKVLENDITYDTDFMKGNE